jgi:hypothetical protein
MALTKVKAGNIILTTPGVSSNDVTPATTQYVTTAIGNLIDTAPSTLNTLNELAAALGDDVNFSTTVTDSIATKLPLAGGTMSGNIVMGNNNIGIGVASPNGRLQFDNGAETRKIVLYEGANNDYQFYGFGVESQTLIYSTYLNTDDHVFVSGASSTSRNELMRIEGDGNVGIGDTNPSALRLSVVTPTANHIGLQVVNSNTADSFGMVVKGGNDANDYTADFRKRDNTNIMRIRGDGNVGIGTTNPSGLLHVGNTSVGLKVRISDDTNQTLDIGIVGGSTVNGGVYYDNPNSGFQSHRVNGSEKLRLTSTHSYFSNGNVGIGNSSPSTLSWPNGSTGGLFLQAGGLLSAYNAGTNLSQNWYYNSGEKFIGNGGASRYVQAGQEHVFSRSTTVNASGAAAALTWSESLRINSSGNATFSGNISAVNITPSGYISQGTGQSHYFRGGTDANWRIGSDIVVDSGGIITGAATQMIVGGSGNTYGFQIFGHQTSTSPCFEVIPNTAVADSITNIRGRLFIGNNEAITADGVVAHVGTSAPSSPSAGKLWFDTTTGVAAMKVYNGSAWNTMSNKFTATGGTYSTYISGGVQYGVHTFTSSGTFTPEGSVTVDVMVVAGGGGGGAWVGSGGGAGGMIVRPGLAIANQAYTITVGAGGARGYNPGGYAGMPFVRTGGDTTAFGLTAKGGGAGVSYSYEYNGGIGGSGSGGANNGTNYPSNAGNQTSQSGDSGTYGFGNAGGTAPGGTGDPYPCGGGGGAGGAGVNATTSVCGNGGVGKANNYRTGSNIYYAGGGGGGHHEGTPTYSSGGNGGGGAGNSGGSNTNAVAGTPNTGGGGGGGGGNGGAISNGAAGGSGIVVVRYVI